MRFVNFYLFYWLINILELCYRSCFSLLSVIKMYIVMFSVIYSYAMLIVNSSGILFADQFTQVYLLSLITVVSS